MAPVSANLASAEDSDVRAIAPTSSGAMSDGRRLAGDQHPRSSGQDLGRWQCGRCTDLSRCLCRLPRRRRDPLALGGIKTDIGAPPVTGRYGHQLDQCGTGRTTSPAGTAAQIMQGLLEHTHRWTAGVAGSVRARDDRHEAALERCGDERARRAGPSFMIDLDVNGTRTA